MLVLYYGILFSPFIYKNVNTVHVLIYCVSDKRPEITKDTYGSDLNCTVAFMSQCYSLRKCKESCKSMGAARYRWFHEQGCCQCIGDTCVSYGLNRQGNSVCIMQEKHHSSNNVLLGFELRQETIFNGIKVSIYKRFCIDKCFAYFMVLSKSLT